MTSDGLTQTLAAPTRGRPIATPRHGVFTWRGAIVGLVLLMWLIPTKRYRLPVDLPFKLEPYRLFILFLLGALVVSVLLGLVRVRGAGHGRALLVLAGAALTSQVANYQEISSAGVETQSLKSLSYFLSVLVAFVLVSSTIQRFDDLHAVIVATVAGATVVALAALYESRARSNLFDSLDSWFPFLENTLEDRYNYRRGRLRVRASAQHPIALAVALMMTLPLAVYLTRSAASTLRRNLWGGAALVITIAALATVSRTAVTVFAAMIVTAVILRGVRITRIVPLLVVLVIGTHFAAPGAIKQMYRAFTPQTGLLSEQQRRQGASGSGRVADIGPALDRWYERPIFGHGLGTVATTAEPAALSPLEEVEGAIIYDNQYLLTLVSLGIAGMVGMLWFVWGAAIKLARAARRASGAVGDALVACAVASVAFAVSMLTFDAFAFVQATLLFAIVAALGLRARELART